MRTEPNQRGKLCSRGLRRNLPGFVAAVLLIGGCGDDGTGPGAAASARFAYTVTGDLELSVDGDDASHRGQAFPDVGVDTFWVISLRGGADNENGGVAFTFPDLDHAPTPGTYALSGSGSGVDAAVLVDGSSPDRFLGHARTGSLVLEETAGDAIGGSFEFESAGNLYPAGGGAESGTLSVVGSFTATLRKPLTLSGEVAPSSRGVEITAVR